MVPSYAIKDRILNQPDIQGYKVLRQDYPIEVPGVPLSTRVVNTKGPGNEETIQEICQGMRRLIPSFAITKVRWLHDPVKQPTHADTRPKTRGTLILSLPTQDIQHQAIRKGIVIDSTLYEARLFENRLIP